MHICDCAILHQRCCELIIWQMCEIFCVLSVTAVIYVVYRVGWVGCGIIVFALLLGFRIQHALPSLTPPLLPPPLPSPSLPSPPHLLPPPPLLPLPLPCPSFQTGPVKALDEDVKHSSHLGNDSHICNQSSSCDSNHDDDDYRRGHDAKQNGVHGNHQADEPNECLEDGAARPPMELMQWCRALVSDDHNWERRVGSEEEAALLEVVRECRVRIKEKLPAMGGDDGEGVWVFDADRKGSKGKQFRSDVDPICTVQDVKRMKVCTPF